MGERSGIAADESQLLELHNNNMHFIDWHWASMAFFAFYDLLRAFRYTTLPNDMHTTSSSPQTGVTCSIP